MTRPRLIAVISAIAASTIAFLVVSRWRLAGTITGAVLIPLIYTFVSHWSHQGLDRAAGWVRRRVLRRGRPDDVDPLDAAATTAPDDARPTPDALVTAARPLKVGGRRTQWLLVGLAAAAVGTSVYALTSQDPAERIIVHERVVEKTVTVTAPPEMSAVQSSSGRDQTVSGGAGADETTSTEVPTTEPGSTSTTVEPVTTTTSPPGTSTTTTTPLPGTSTTTAPPTTTPPSP